MLVSFEICTDGIRTVLRGGEGEIKLDKLTFTRGTIQEGYISDLETVAKAVREQLAVNAPKARQCEFLLPTQSDNVKIKEVTLPSVKTNKLLQLLRTQLAASVPDVDRYVVDYIPFDAPDQERVNLLAVLAPIRLIEQYVQLSGKLNLKCTEIQLRFARLRQMMRERIAEPVCIVMDLAEDVIELSLLEDEKVFVRVLPIQEQDSTLADWGITFAAAAPGLIEQAGALAEKANSLMQFQLSRNREMPVTAIYAVGDSVRFGDMIAECSRHLHREITFLQTEDAPEPAQASAEETAQAEVSA